jgi:hypothetical protein
MKKDTTTACNSFELYEGTLAHLMGYTYLQYPFAVPAACQDIET